jgi:ABC-type phosphate transport system substrate-binding protein
MTKTALRRLALASLPAALIAGTTFADASPAAQPARVPLARPAQSTGLQPRFSRVRPFQNNAPRTTFVAGGATAPALGYLGSPALSQNPGLPAAGSVLGEFLALDGITTQYCQTGSGFGKKVFDGDPGAGGVNGTCPVLGQPVISSNGFGAPSSLDLTDPDFVGSDIPMLQTEYTEYVTNKSATRGEPVEFPAVIGSISLFYNLNGETGRINLSSAEICNIVTGKTTNWGFAGKAFAKTPLFFVYRSDSAGTTFSFSNHLVKVCNIPSLNVAQYYTAPAPTVSVIGPTPPINSVGETGNVGVANEIVAHNGYIGYVETANALADLAPPTVNFATVNGKDPVTNLPETAAAFHYSTADIATDSVVNTTGGPATVAALNPPPAKAGCVKIAIPAKYANITNGYSIISVSGILMSTTGNGAQNAANLQKLVGILNTPADFGSSGITTVDPANKTPGTGKTGYAALGTTFNAPLKALAAACVGA